MPAPALSGLAAAARPPPAPLRSRPDPRAGGAAGRASHPPWGSGLRWVRPPRGCPARFCFPVTSSLRTGLCRTGRPGSSSHPSPPGPGSSRGASPGSAPPGPAAGTALPAPDGTRRDGTGWGTQPPAGLPRPQNGDLQQMLYCCVILILTLPYILRKCQEEKMSVGKKLGNCKSSATK
ncbi:uncharacterized protein GJ701_007966 [Geothlypis trichas]